MTLPIDEIAEVCRRYRVRELAVFGSAAREEMRADSDIDLLVDFQPDAPGGLLEYTGLMLDLSEVLHRNVDLVERQALKPLLRQAVLSEARTIYGVR